MDLDPVSDELEESRHDVDLHVEIFEGAKPLECPLVGVVREGDDHALDVEEADDRREPLDIAEQREVLETLSALLRLGVHETDEIHPVFRMDKELLREQLSDVARTDYDRVLDIGRVPPCKRPRPGAADANERDCEGPEDHELLRARMRDIAQICDDRNEPHANRDHMEDAAEVVGGRVVGTLVVVVVETVELRDRPPMPEA